MIKNVIFDWKRTLYDPDTKKLVDGALDLLEFMVNKSLNRMVSLGIVLYEVIEKHF